MHCVAHVLLLPREIVNIWKGHFRDFKGNEGMKNDIRLGLRWFVKVSFSYVYDLFAKFHEVK